MDHNQHTMSTSSAQRLSNPFHSHQPTEVQDWLDCDFLNDEDEEVNVVAFNDSGSYLAAGTAHGRLVVWDMVTLSCAVVVVRSLSLWFCCPSVVACFGCGGVDVL